jgi:hypothetical protein
MALFPIGPLGNFADFADLPASNVNMSLVLPASCCTISPWELEKYRAHIDEAISDPDYDVVVSYECRWDE